MATIYTHKSSNVRKTWALMTGFLVFIIAVGFLFSQAMRSPVILWIAVIFSIVMNIVSFWFSDKIVLMMTGAREAPDEEFMELHRVVENLAITAGLPKPRVYIVDDPQPNAFATGRNPQNAVVAVTRGLLDRLERSELEGVIAHELSHIGNRDMLISTVVVVLAGIVAVLSDIFLRMMFWGGRSRDRDSRAGPLFLILALAAAILAPLAATLIRLAISRKREFLADASGVLLTRYPEGLTGALQKISSYPQSMRAASNATAHLFFENPFRERGGGTNWLVKLFMTHPPVEERIKALREMGGGV